MDPLIPSTPPTEPVTVTPAPPAEPPGGRRLPLVAIVVAVVALVGGVVLGAVVFGGDDGDTEAGGTTTTATEGATTTREGDASTTTLEGAPSTQPSGDAIAPPTTIDTDGLDGEALDLATAINKAYGLKYHAAYEGSLVGSNGGQTDVTLEVWRDPTAFARRDTTIEGEHGISTREIRRPENIYGCLTPDMKEYVCTRGHGNVDPADPIFGAVDPHEGQVVSAQTTGDAARCFTVISASGEQDVCFDSDGIPVLVETKDGRLTRTSVDRSVVSADFDLPAEPSGDITNSTSTTTS